MTQPTQRLDLSITPHPSASPKWNGFDPDGNRAATVLLGSAALAGDGNQQFAIAGASWVIAGYSGGTIDRSNCYIAMSNPTPADGVYTETTLYVDTLGIKEVFVQFSARYPGAHWGSKFCKFHGITTPSNHANCTFGQNAYGDFNYIGFGDGAITGNDVNESIYMDVGMILGRNTGIANFIVPTQGTFTTADYGSTWHDFRVHAKFNDGTTAGNEVPNGEFFIEVYGRVICHVTGIYNRHYSNDNLERIVLGDYTAGGPAYELDVRDIKISTGWWA